MMTGPASTGKTMLALDVSSKLGLPSVINTARRAGKQLGVRPGLIEDIDTLLEFQETAAAIMLMEFSRHESFVADRPPSDILGYAVLGMHRLADRGQKINDKHIEWLRNIRDVCEQMAHDHAPDLMVECSLETPFRHDGFRFGGTPEERSRERNFLRVSRRAIFKDIQPLMARGTLEKRAEMVLKAIEEEKAA